MCVWTHTDHRAEYTPSLRSQPKESESLEWKDRATSFRRKGERGLRCVCSRVVSLTTARTWTHVH